MALFYQFVYDNSGKTRFYVVFKKSHLNEATIKGTEKKTVKHLDV